MARITGRPCRSILQRVWFTFPRRPMVAARSRSKPISFTSLENEIPESSALALAQRVLLLQRLDRCRPKDNTLCLSHGILSRKRNVAKVRQIHQYHMPSIGPYVVVTLILSRSVMPLAAQGESPKAETQIQKETSENPLPEAAPTEEGAERNREGENLLGQSDTSKGEARRNENVQINLLDTNAVRELNARVGTTATIVEEFVAERGYWAAEYGTPPRNAIRAQLQQGSGVHGSLFWNHNNSVFSARSFFQVGPVKPARDNQYGATLGMQLWD